MWELWRAGLQKNIVFTAAVAVLVSKYIYCQYLCEQANAGTAMWTLWRAGLAK